MSFEAVKNFTITYDGTAAVPTSTNVPLFCEFDPDLMVITDYSVVLTADGTADAVCTVLCPELINVDGGRIFNFTVGAKNAAAPFGTTDMLLQKKIACSGRKINGNFTFTFVKAANLSPLTTSRFLITFTVSFRRYSRKALGLKGNKELAPDSGQYFL